MSKIKFYIKSDDRLIPLYEADDYSCIFMDFEDYVSASGPQVVSYEQIQEISKVVLSDLSSMEDDVHQKLQDKNLISAFNNTPADKLYQIKSIDNEVKAISKSIVYSLEVSHFCAFLSTFISYQGNEDCLYAEVIYE